MQLTLRDGFGWNERRIRKTGKLPTETHTERQTGAQEDNISMDSEVASVNENTIALKGNAPLNGKSV